jgi:hypothetical protein
MQLSKKKKKRKNYLIFFYFIFYRSWGKQYSEVMMGGDTFDDSLKSAMEYCKKNNNIFVHAFDDDKTIEG